MTDFSLKIYIYLTFFIFFSCFNKFEEKENNIIIGTKIDYIELNHWGKGYYKTIIHYSFVYERKLYKNSNKIEGLTRAQNQFFFKGDSLLIYFPKTNPNKSKVLKKINF